MISKKNLAGYPDPLATPEQKMEESYGLAYFKQMYADFAGGGSRDYKRRKARFRNAREYAEGVQKVSKYKKLLGNSGDLSYLSLDWSVVPVIPKFVDVVVGSLTNQDYEVRCTAVDKVSQDAKRDEEMR